METYDYAFKIVGFFGSIVTILGVFAGFVWAFYAARTGGESSAAAAAEAKRLAVAAGKKADDVADDLGQFRELMHKEYVHVRQFDAFEARLEAFGREVRGSLDGIRDMLINHFSTTGKNQDH